MMHDTEEKLRNGDGKNAMKGLTLSAQFNEEDWAADFWGKVENEVVGVETVDVREAIRNFLHD